MRRTLSIACLIIGFAAVTFAQEDEFVPLPTIKVEKQVRLRRDPSTRKPGVRVLKTASELRLLDENPVGGFYRVIFGKGKLGWVWLKNMGTPIQAMATAPAAGANCPASLGACPEIGCAQSETAQAVFNSTKRRPPMGTNARTLTFANFRTLQQQADNLVGQRLELSQADRNKLINLSLSGGSVREGKLVRLSGFIAEGLEPHANSGESVNCKLPKAAENDFHISIAPHAGDDEFKSIVVEMIPQDRNPGWTLAKLKSISEQKKRVLVVGALFYDNIHTVNDDAAHPLQRQPKRIALWELHRVVKFFVCTKAANNCNASSTAAGSGWKPLENF